MKQKLKDWDTTKGKENQTLIQPCKVIKHLKLTSKKKKICNISHASVVLYRARTNFLPLENRKRHTNEDTTCKLHKQEKGNLWQHFLFTCPAYQEHRTEIRKLQQPYPEDKTMLLGELWFQEEDIEYKKEAIYKMWKTRMEKVERTWTAKMTKQPTASTATHTV